MALSVTILLPTLGAITVAPIALLEAATALLEAAAAFLEAAKALPTKVLGLLRLERPDAVPPREDRFRFVPTVRLLEATGERDIPILLPIESTLLVFFPDDLLEIGGRPMVHSDALSLQLIPASRCRRVACLQGRRTKPNLPGRST